VMKLLPLALGIVFVTNAVRAFEPGGVMQESDKYLDLVESLLSEPPMSSEAITDKIGVTLRPISKTARVRDEGAGAGADGLAFEKVSLSYMPNGEPAVFVLTIAPEAAPSKEDVFARFEDLKLTAAPTGRSIAEEAEYSRKESWGLLAFGFAERARKKLRSIIFNYVKKD
jgi:hypothetical protein